MVSAHDQIRQTKRMIRTLTKEINQLNEAFEDSGRRDYFWHKSKRYHVNAITAKWREVTKLNRKLNKLERGVK